MVRDRRVFLYFVFDFNSGFSIFGLFDFHSNFHFEKALHMVFAFGFIVFDDPSNLVLFGILACAKVAVHIWFKLVLYWRGYAKQDNKGHLSFTSHADSFRFWLFEKNRQCC